MKSKKIKKILMILLTCSMFIGGNSITTFAYGNGGESTEQATDEEGKKEKSEVTDDGSDNKEDALDVEWNVTEKEDPDGDGILTPVGNLTLVDDIDEEMSEKLQYMTVKTKSGNIFYLIVDRSGDEDNVYFLNMVDESDLMALMDEDTQEKFKEATLSVDAVEDKDETADTVLFSNQKDENATEEVTDGADTKTDKQTGANPIILLVIFGLIGAGVAGGYYYFKIKPQKEQPDVDEDMEFYDDEDYVDEDTAVDEDTLDDDVDDPEETSDEETKENEYRHEVDDFSDECVD